MRALVTRLRPDGRREKVLVSDWPAPPAPGPTQVRTQTLYTGITNGTERNDLIGGNYATPDAHLPAQCGYQNVGRVVEIGAEVTTLAVGDLLYMSENHLEYCTVDAGSLLVKVPPEVDPVHAALFGMTSVAMRTCRRAELRMGEQVLVVGAGVIGQVAAQIAHVMGARVTLVDIDDRRLELARRIGAVEAACNIDGDGWDRHISTTYRYSWAPEGRFDAVIDLAGVPGMEDKLLDAVKHRGRVSFIAGRGAVHYTFNTGQGREITLLQNSHFDNDDLANLCRLVAGGQVTLALLIQDVVPAAEAQRIYDTLRDTPNALYGTVFTWM